MTRRSEPCPIKGCIDPKARGHLMCRRHWRMVPAKLRQAVNAAWKLIARPVRASRNNDIPTISASATSPLTGRSATRPSQRRIVRRASMPRDDTAAIVKKEMFDQARMSGRILLDYRASARLAEDLGFDQDDTRDIGRWIERRFDIALLPITVTTVGALIDQVRAAIKAKQESILVTR